jgi:hypothetical protein
MIRYMVRGIIRNCIDHKNKFAGQFLVIIISNFTGTSNLRYLSEMV